MYLPQALQGGGWNNQLLVPCLSPPPWLQSTCGIEMENQALPLPLPQPLGYNLLAV